MGLKQRITSVVEWVMKRKPVRVLTHYNEGRGPILAAGLSYQAIFAVFASIWVVFAIAGSVIRSNPQLQQALFGLLQTSIPGLIDSGDGNGAINPNDLLSAVILNFTGVIAAGVLVFTALGWLASGRDAVRTMFEVPNPATNFLLLKLRDLVTALAFAVGILLSAALTVLSSALLDWALDGLGINSQSDFANIAGRAVGFIIVFLLDATVLGLFYRFVSGIAIPFRLLAQGTVIAALALGVLKLLGTALLGGVTNNPLLASFAVIIGLLIWFNLICQVILIGAAWISVSARDNGLDLTGKRTPVRTVTARKVAAGPSDTAAAL